MKLGFIGMGNMASALVRGFIASGKVQGADIVAYDPDAAKLGAVAAELGFMPVADEAAVAHFDDDKNLLHRKLRALFCACGELEGCA